MQEPAVSRSASVLGLTGTLLVHAFLLQSLLSQSGPRSAGVSVAEASDGTSALSSVLIQPIGSAVRDSVQRTASEVQKRVSPSAAHRPPPDPLLLLDLGEESVGEDQHRALDLGERNALLQRCRREYPEEARLAQDLANVSLQDAVLTDGRIDRAEVKISGTETPRALMALSCLQAYGTFGTAVVGLN